MVTLVPLFGDTIVFCFDAGGIEEIATNPGRFPKNLSMYSMALDPSPVLCFTFCIRFHFLHPFSLYLLITFAFMVIGFALAV